MCVIDPKSDKIYTIRKGWFWISANLMRLQRACMNFIHERMKNKWKALFGLVICMNINKQQSTHYRFKENREIYRDE